MKQYVVFLARVFAYSFISLRGWHLESISASYPSSHSHMVVCNLQYVKGQYGHFKRFCKCDGCMYIIEIESISTFMSKRKKLFIFEDEIIRAVQRLHTFSTPTALCSCLCCFTYGWIEFGNSLTICSWMKWIVFTIWFEMAFKSPMLHNMVSDVFTSPLRLNCLLPSICFGSKGMHL